MASPTLSQRQFIKAASCRSKKTVMGRFRSVATGRKRPRLCENACAILKSALLRKICQRLVNQQAVNLSRNAIFFAVLTVKPTSKRFHTAWTNSSHWLTMRFTGRFGGICVDCYTCIDASRPIQCGARDSLEQVFGADVADDLHYRAARWRPLAKQVRRISLRTQPLVAIAVTSTPCLRPPRRPRQRPGFD